MSTFDDARTQLATAQATAAAARAAFSAARNAGRRDPQLDAARSRAHADVVEAVAAFGAFNDPRQSVQNLADTAPFVLFPVRLETRFGTRRTNADGTHGGAAAVADSHQLWVRIYPDDCSIDTFEANLSATELGNVKRYWQNVWRAAGDDGRERAAWADLVAAHGSGRAGYLVDTYQPSNPADQPVRVAPTDEFLVVPTQTPPAAADANAVAQYWTAVWTANSSSELDAARAALDAAVGAPQAAQLVADYAPFNLADVPAPPDTKSSVAVTTVFLVFAADPPTKPASWTEAPHVVAFPDRFVVLGYRGGVQVVEALGGPITLPLFVGPDPSADSSDGIHPEGADLVVPDELKWMVDFDAAVAAGMGVAVDLTAADAELGFDRLVVLGLRLAADAPTSAATLGELFTHHHIGRAGLSLIPQGSPAHNISGTASAYTRLDDADQSFADRRAAPLFGVTTDPNHAADGLCLATALGIAPSTLEAVHGAGGQDQARARAMQRAMWPATLGYWLDKLLEPTFDDETVAAVRAYYTGYVRGRGTLPAIRIGAQAYGVLPTTAFSRIGWLDEPRGAGSQAFLGRLLRLLRVVQSDWTGLEQGVSRVGGTGDAHQILLDILGLHPDSAEYFWRYSESLTELYNVFNLWGLGPQFWEALTQLGLQLSGVTLLAHLGDPNLNPDLLQHAFFSESGLVKTVVDDRPSSETDPVRAYTDDGRNYLHWLADTAGASLDDVVGEHGFTDDASPESLLYLYLRHAVLLGYYDSSYYLHRSAGFLNTAELAAMKPEPSFIHVDASASASESRYGALYKLEPRITASPTQLVSDYITTNLATLSESSDLADLIAAVRQLADAPTSELERLFAEHVDTCSYRLDSWLLGLATLQLEQMRRTAAPGEKERGNGAGDGGATGCYLGAYAWVEHLRPSGSVLRPVEPADDVAADFAAGAPLVHDSANGGYIHAPSLPHARSAAVLRSGYLAAAGEANPSTLAVNLSSDRVRLALATLEGIRNGQSIGALLGYRFERGLHDSSGLAEVDKFIYPLRKAFPLVADSLSSTTTPNDVPIEAIEASNVLDGRKLIARIESSGVSTYPFGLRELPAATATEAGAIDAQVQAMLDVNDAIADVALAEGVHQAVQGNFDRAAATLDAYGIGSFPPDPEVVQTPAPGIGLTHRVAVHLAPGLTAPAGAGPRAVAEPAVERWLGTVLPAPAAVGATVTWTDPTDGTTAHAAPVTLADLDLGALDIVHLVRPDDVQAMTELDDRILRFILATAQPRPDAELHIAYRTPATTYSVFEVGALVRSVQGLLTVARPLRATDMVPSTAARSGHNLAQFADRTRIDGPKSSLDTLLADLTTYLTPLQGLLADPIANRTALVNGTDAALDAAVALLERAALLGVPQAGWGFCYDWRHQAMRDLYATVRAFVTRCDARLAAFDAAIASYDALPVGTSDTARFQTLQGAEAQVVAHLGPLPATPAAMRAALPTKRAALAAKRIAAEAVLTTNHATFGAALVATGTIVPIDDVDPEPLDFTAFGDRAVTMCGDLLRAVGAVLAAGNANAATVTAQLAAYTAATTDTDRVAALTAAAHALFGSNFQFLADFVLPADQTTTWTEAAAAATSGALLQYLTTTVGIPDPAPEWATGAARVRPAMHTWEAISLLAPAFGSTEPTLTPAQVPYAAGDPWLAMQFPADFVINGDRLLYTACHTQPFDATLHQCGLLIDEWTEVIPATTKDTGLTFQFDRPDNEPPQAILVVTPATADGVWHWEDLTAALNETLELAKLRAIEPAHIDPTPYSRLLPATVMAVTTHGISISTALAACNGALRAREVTENA